MHSSRGESLTPALNDNPAYDMIAEKNDGSQHHIDD